MLDSYTPAMMTPSAYVANHPLRAALLVTWTLALVAILVSVALLSFFPTLSGLGLSLVTDAAFAVFALVFLWRLHWLKRVGFSAPRQWRSLHLYLMPLLLILAIIFYQRSWFALPLSIVVVCLVGFAEETLFRGLILQILLPLGTLGALLGSSVLFAALHLLNLLSGEGFSQLFPILLFAFAIGFAFAVLRLLTATLWPLILLHALIDLASYARTSSASSLDLAFTLALSSAFLLYGISLYRHRLAPSSPLDTS